MLSEKLVTSSDMKTGLEVSFRNNSAKDAKCLHSQIDMSLLVFNKRHPDPDQISISVFQETHKGLPDGLLCETFGICRNSMITGSSNSELCPLPSETDMICDNKTSDSLGSLISVEPK